MPKIINKLIRQPWFRAIGIPAYRFYARQHRGRPGPKVAAISLPKAGTHLLSRVLNQLPSMMFSGYHLSEEDVFSGAAGTASDETLDQVRLDHAIQRCLPGQYFTGHFPAVSRLRNALRSGGIATLFILRDPRDIVVSYVHYVCGEPRHFHHGFYNKQLHSFDQRLHKTISGFAANEHTPIGLTSIGESLRAYAGWLDDPDVTVCRFEELVGPQGGGTQEDQLETIRRVAKVAGRECDSATVRRIAETVFSTKSRTFRRGNAGGWRESFNAEHRELFSQSAGAMLQRYGYSHR